MVCGMLLYELSTMWTQTKTLWYIEPLHATAAPSARMNAWMTPFQSSRCSVLKGRQVMGGSAECDGLMVAVGRQLSVAGSRALLAAHGEWPNSSTTRTWYWGRDGREGRKVTELTLPGTCSSDSRIDSCNAWQARLQDTEYDLYILRPEEGPFPCWNVVSHSILMASLQQDAGGRAAGKKVQLRWDSGRIRGPTALILGGLLLSGWEHWRRCLKLKLRRRCHDEVILMKSYLWSHTYEVILMKSYLWSHTCEVILPKCTVTRYEMKLVSHARRLLYWMMLVSSQIPTGGCWRFFSFSAVLKLWSVKPQTFPLPGAVSFPVSYHVLSWSIAIILHMSMEDIWWFPEIGVPPVIILILISSFGAPG